MATRTVVMSVCDNCGMAVENVEEFTFAHGRKQRVVEAGEACGCAMKLIALMDKGRVAGVTVNGRKRGRPSNAELARRQGNHAIAVAS